MLLARWHSYYEWLEDYKRAPYIPISLLAHLSVSRPQSLNKTQLPLPASHCSSSLSS